MRRRPPLQPPGADDDAPRAHPLREASRLLQIEPRPDADARGRAARGVPDHVIPYRRDAPQEQHEWRQQQRAQIVQNQEDPERQARDEDVRQRERDNQWERDYATAMEIERENEREARRAEARRQQELFRRSREFQDSTVSYADLQVHEPADEPMEPQTDPQPRRRRSPYDDDEDDGDRAAQHEEEMEARRQADEYGYGQHQAPQDDGDSDDSRDMDDADPESMTIEQLQKLIRHREGVFENLKSTRSRLADNRLNEVEAELNNLHDLLAEREREAQEDDASDYDYEMDEELQSRLREINEKEGGNTQPIDARFDPYDTYDA